MEDTNLQELEKKKCNEQGVCCGLFLGNSTALLCLFVSQNRKSKIPIDKPRRIFRRGTNNNTISKT